MSGNGVNYKFKHDDRSPLLKLLRLKETCDEILIVKDDFITDTSFSNVVFEKNGAFFTPRSYLLNGTKRQYLLEKNRITEKEIRVNEIHSYDRIFLINAMLDVADWEGGIPCTQIFT